MDLHLRHAASTDEERAAVDALLGPPRSAWDGGERGIESRDTHTATGGREAREQRHLLLPALRALQARVGWISETSARPSVVLPEPDSPMMPSVSPA